MPLPIVAIVGRPNVGKSSLFNYLAGRRISIVDPTAGVTRDRVSTLIQADDRYVVMGAGDALHLRFDARALPALPDGWRRDFLLFLDGWAKDRDPNSVEALHVEPLPFHAMSGYPYRADEHFPDDSQHRAWRLEWQTRPTRRWVQPLAASAPLFPKTPPRTE